MTHGMWHVVGFTGQGIFASRFLVQWLASEAKGRSVFPTYFWYASLMGSLLLMSYAVYTRDPVFIVGQGFGVVVYTRNLQMIRRHSSQPDGA